MAVTITLSNPWKPVKDWIIRRAIWWSSDWAREKKFVGKVKIRAGQHLSSATLNFSKYEGSVWGPNYLIQTYYENGPADDKFDGTVFNNLDEALANFSMIREFIGKVTNGN